MGKQQHASKSTQDVSTVSASKLLQTRPLQAETQASEQQTPQAEAEFSSTSKGFDLTKPGALLVGDSSPPALGQPLQAKLTIGKPDDKYEQEADRVAQNVVQRINSLQSEPAPQDETVQRHTDEDELQMKPMLRRQAVLGGGDASSELETSINHAKGAGQPLDLGLQRSMGQAMGADFSEVKIHADTAANELSQSIQAKAFTTGQDIFFKQGAYDPHSHSGQQLIAHELTHVVQQKGSGIQRKPEKNQQRPKIFVNAKEGTENRISRAIEIDDTPHELSEIKKELATRYGYKSKSFPALDEILTSLDNRFYSDWEYLKNDIEELKTSRHLEAMEAAGDDELMWAGSGEAIFGLKRWISRGVEPTAMNCFHTVIYTAVKAGLVTKKYLQTALKNFEMETVDSQGFKSSFKVNAFAGAVVANRVGRIEWKQSDEESLKSAYAELASANIPAGHVIVFGDQGEHVALSTGGQKAPSKAGKFQEMGRLFGQHEMIENDSGNSEATGNPTDVRKTTVEDSLDHYGYASSSLNWGPLPTKKEILAML